MQSSGLKSREAEDMSGRSFHSHRRNKGLRARLESNLSASLHRNMPRLQFAAIVLCLRLFLIVITRVILIIVASSSWSSSLSSLPWATRNEGFTIEVGSTGGNTGSLVGVGEVPGSVRFVFAKRSKACESVLSAECVDNARAALGAVQPKRSFFARSLVRFCLVCLKSADSHQDEGSGGLGSAPIS